MLYFLTEHSEWKGCNSSTSTPRKEKDSRLQRLRAGPFVDMLKGVDETEVWLDGGHNPHAARALAQTMADFEEKSAKPLVLICGMQENKDADGSLGHVCPRHTCPLFERRSPK